MVALPSWTQGSERVSVDDVLQACAVGVPAIIPEFVARDHGFTPQLCGDKVADTCAPQIILVWCSSGHWPAL